MTVRRQLADGCETTIHVARFAVAEVDVRVVAVSPPEPLVDWCARENVANAVVGGFFVRSAGIPLGELRIGGLPISHVPFGEPWDGSRSCISIASGAVTLGPRSDFPVAPEGDLLQAGPMLLWKGTTLIRDGEDPEGFSSGSEQFDSDITVGRHPRAALGLGGGELIAAVCDGRAADEAGLTLAELAETMRVLGAEHALNLDGGGSATLVAGGRLRNSPREQHGILLPNGRAVSTALVIASRAESEGVQT